MQLFVGEHNRIAPHAATASLPHDLLKLPLLRPLIGQTQNPQLFAQRHEPLDRRIHIVAAVGQQLDDLPQPSPRRTVWLPRQKSLCIDPKRRRQ